MTDPDPRTDLAGYLGLTEEQARICRQSAEDGYTGIRGKVGARLIEQDQARDAEPDDGLIPITDPEPVEGPPGTEWVDPTGAGLTEQEARVTANAPSGGGLIGSAHAKIAERLRESLPAPKSPWKSPLADLPDLTEEQCRDAYDAGIDPYCYDPWAQIGRALKAAGWTPVEEADRG